MFCSVRDICALSQRQRLNQVLLPALLLLAPCRNCVYDATIVSWREKIRQNGANSSSSFSLQQKHTRTTALLYCTALRHCGNSMRHDALGCTVSGAASVSEHFLTVEAHLQHSISSAALV
jgi:hypothetical protein